MENSALLKYIAPISQFDGEEIRKGEAWLKSLKRVREVSKMEDNIAIIVASSNLVGKAGIWWESVEEEVKTWEEFEKKFKNKYMKGKVEEAWRKIKQMRQREGQEVEEFVSEMNSLFKTVGMEDETSKISFLIASVHESIAYELEKEGRQSTKFAEVVDKAIEIEQLQHKYHKLTYSKERRVTFNIENANDNINQENVMDASVKSTGSDVTINSVPNSIDKAVQDLANQMRELQIHLVQMKEQQNQPPRNQYYSSRPPFSSERRPVICWTCGKEGHPSRFCPDNSNGMGGVTDVRGNTSTNQIISPQKTNNQHKNDTPTQNQSNKELEHNSPRINMIEVVENKSAKKDRKKKEREVDVYAIKRKEREDDSQTGQKERAKRKGKGKVVDTAVPIQPKVPGPNVSTQPMIPQQFTHQSQFQVQPQPHFNPPQQVMLPITPHQGQIILPQISQAPVVPQKSAKKKPRKKPRTRLPVDVPENPTWDVLKSTPVTMNMAEYLAMNKKVAKDVKDGITFLHGRKPSKKAQGQAKAKVGEPMIINTLRVEELLDEEEYERRKHNKNGDRIDESDTEDSSEASDSEEESDSSEESSEFESSDESDGSYFDDSEDDEDTVIDYPFNIEAMKRAKPTRVYITINGKLTEAILDSGAAVSVLSHHLAEKLGVQVSNQKTSISLTGFQKGKGKQCKVATHVEVRIGGKLRRGHFCVDQAERTKDLCLLGRSWIKKHNVIMKDEGRTVVIPTKNGTSSVEVSCLEDDDEYDEVIDDENDDVSMTPIYAVNIYHEETEQNRVKNIETKELLTYQEDTLSDSFVENEARQVKPNEEGETSKSMNDLVDTYKHCFVEESGLGRVNNVYHEIPTTSEIPIRAKPYRLTLDEEQSLKDEINSLLKLDIIRPSNGRWTAPIFFVPKKDGSLRLVVNYQALNSITVKDGYPLPHIEEVLDSLGGATYFSTLDAASGFWQVEMHPNSVEKTGFVTKFGTYEFNVMPFGLTSAPSTFQRMMSDILRDYIGIFVYVFIDDILIYSKDEESHLEHLRKVFEACDGANLRLRREKCQFGKRNVVYLGHEVGRDGLKPSSHNVKKILSLKEPKNVDEIRSLLGMTGYYRRFIEDYATRAQPLTRLVKKNVPFEWKEEQQDAFNYLTSSLISPPVLAYPNPDHVKIVTTDASYRGLGAVLSQSGTEEGETVISYGSKSVNNTQLGYAPAHLEALSIIWAVNRYRYYLSSKKKFMIRTDNAALEFILNNDKPCYTRKEAKILLTHCRDWF
ncbi:hypothetical protein G6F64_011112 [Rhizopus arrhizus]|uniref:Gag-pol fusion protein n=1 Tax=Rhizopus oryzae TaxID=64495 RepID=A0A9P6X0A9_RHIOR|nr:hypothetical protein G6F64_011112 [Rhizopus arrhizus]